MYGGCNMGNIEISIDDTNSYIDMLINQCFSILPLYEENGNCKMLIQKIDNLLHRLNGFFKMNNFNSNITIDILKALLESYKILDKKKSSKLLLTSDYFFFILFNFRI